MFSLRKRQKLSLDYPQCPLLFGALSSERKEFAPFSVVKGKATISYI